MEDLCPCFGDICLKNIGWNVALQIFIHLTKTPYSFKNWKNNKDFKQLKKNGYLK